MTTLGDIHFRKCEFTAFAQCAVSQRRTNDDLAEEDWLLGSETVVTDEFEDCEEHAYNLAAEGLTLEQRGEAHFLLAANEVADLFNIDLNGCLVVADAGVLFDLFALQHAAERTHEVPQFNLLDAVAGRVATRAGAVI